MEPTMVVAIPTVVQVVTIPTMIRAGDFISYRPFYNDDVPLSKIKQFYIAKVIGLKPEIGAVQVKTYYTKSKPPTLLDSNKHVRYSIYNGSASIQDVRVADIFTIFHSLTSRGTLNAQHKRAISRALTAAANLDFPRLVPH